jgi:hypothetical protein
MDTPSQVLFVKRGLGLQGFSSSGFKASASWQNHGNCVICGIWAVLESRCTRCEKRSCGDDRCRKIVKNVLMCGVPERALKSRRGDLVESPSSLVFPSAF